MTGLVPVSGWIYDLYAVRYTDREGNTLSARTCVTTYPCVERFNEMSPDDHCEWIEWHLIAENVGEPKIVGNIYGLPIHENGWSHAERIAR